MKKKFILALLFLTTILSYGQKEPENSITLDSKIADLYIHNTTGIPIAITNGGVYGIDGSTGKEIWNFKESGLVSSLNSLGQDGGSSFVEIPYSPFGKFGQTIFNIKSGKKIIDNNTNEFKKIISNNYVLGKEAVLFIARKEEKKIAKLFLATSKNNTVVWESEIKADKKITNVSNYIQNDTKIAFTAGKTVFLVNKNDGKVILMENYDAGALFFTEDDKSLIAVENKGSSLIGGAIKAGFTMGLSLLSKKAIGKEVIAFNTENGEETWKKAIKLNEGFVDHHFENGKLFLIHKDGAKLYDYNTGKEVWKKEFKKSKIKKLEKTSEGYLVFYKNKKHLVDNNGKKIWKKSKKLIKNVDFEVDDEEEYTVFEYNAGTIFVTPNRIEYFKKDQEKRVYKINLDEEKDKLTYDKKNNNLILLDGKKLYILNPDNGLGKEQVKKIDFNNSKKITTIETRKSGYFINGNWEFIITDFEGNVTKKEYYTQPGEGLRLLKNVGSGIAGVAAAKFVPSNNGQQKTLASSSNFVNKNNSDSNGTYVSKYGKDFENLSNSLYTPERFNAFKSTKNNAFFFTKKNGKKVLLQINKDSGNLIETYEFAVNNPKYKIDKLEKRIYFRKGNELKIFSYE